MPKDDITVQIHHFYNEEGVSNYDKNGELLLGWYWQESEESDLIGPFNTRKEAEDDCLKEFHKDKVVDLH